MKVREGELEFGEHMIAPFYSACDALKEMHESTDYGNSTDVSGFASSSRPCTEGRFPLLSRLPCNRMRVRTRFLPLKNPSKLWKKSRPRRKNRLLLTKPKIPALQKTRGLRTHPSRKPRLLSRLLQTNRQPRTKRFE